MSVNMTREELLKDKEIILDLLRHVVSSSDEMSYPLLGKVWEELCDKLVEIDKKIDATPEKVDQSQNPLSEWKLVDLKARAKSLGIPGYSIMKKNELIAVLTEKTMEDIEDEWNSI